MRGRQSELLLCIPASHQVVGIKACKVCIVTGDGRRPKGLPTAVPALRDEWLLAAAETVSLPTISAHHLIND